MESNNLFSKSICCCARLSAALGNVLVFIQENKQTFLPDSPGNFVQSSLLVDDLIDKIRSSVLDIDNACKNLENAQMQWEEIKRIFYDQADNEQAD